MTRWERGGERTGERTAVAASEPHPLGVVRIGRQRGSVEPPSPVPGCSEGSRLGYFGWTPLGLFQNHGWDIIHNHGHDFLFSESQLGSFGLWVFFFSESQLGYFSAAQLRYFSEPRLGNFGWTPPWGFQNHSCDVLAGIPCSRALKQHLKSVSWRRPPKHCHLLKNMGTECNHL